MTIHKNKGLSLRIAEDNPNHHIYCNNGTWWIHYTTHPCRVTSDRKRASLKTRDLAVARKRRDAFLAHLGFEREEARA